MAALIVWLIWTFWIWSEISEQVKAVAIRNSIGWTMIRSESAYLRLCWGERYRYVTIPWLFMQVICYVSYPFFWEVLVVWNSLRIPSSVCSRRISGPLYQLSDPSAHQVSFVLDGMLFFSSSFLHLFIILLNKLKFKSCECIWLDILFNSSNDIGLDLSFLRSILLTFAI